MYAKPISTTQDKRTDRMNVLTKKERFGFHSGSFFHAYFRGATTLPYKHTCVHYTYAYFFPCGGLDIPGFLVVGTHDNVICSFHILSYVALLQYHYWTKMVWSTQYKCPLVAGVSLKFNVGLNLKKNIRTHLSK